MSSDRNESSNGSAEPADGASRTAPAAARAGAGLPGASTETRVRYLAQHLAVRGRLNMQVLAAEWGVSHQDLMSWLSSLHRQGSFERFGRNSLEFEIANPFVVAEEFATDAGQVLRGIKKPCECPAFGRECTPSAPLGAKMVSSEGACAAYFQHRRPSEVA